MKITVCIGSACHLKGARQVVEELQYLIKSHDLADRVDLSGTFCMGTCQDDVSVTLDGKTFSLKPEATADFFKQEVLAKV